MPSHHSQKARIRARMEATGETYTTARRHVRGEDQEADPMKESSTRDPIPPSVRASFPDLAPNDVPEMLVWLNPGVGFGSGVDLDAASDMASEMIRTRVSAAQLREKHVEVSYEVADWLVKAGAKQVHLRSALEAAVLRYLKGVAGVLSDKEEKFPTIFFEFALEDEVTPDFSRLTLSLAQRGVTPIRYSDDGKGVIYRTSECRSWDAAKTVVHAAAVEARTNGYTLHQLTDSEARSKKTQGERVAGHFFATEEFARQFQRYEPDDRAGFWFEITRHFDNGNLVCIVPNPPGGYETVGHPLDPTQHWPYIRFKGDTTIYKRTARRILDTGTLVVDLMPFSAV
jgi:hypothetical protein